MNKWIFECSAHYLLVCQGIIDRMESQIRLFSSKILFKLFWSYMKRSTYIRNCPKLSENIIDSEDLNPSFQWFQYPTGRCIVDRLSYFSWTFDSSFYTNSPAWTSVRPNASFAWRTQSENIKLGYIESFCIRSNKPWSIKLHSIIRLRWMTVRHEFEPHHIHQVE